MAKKMGAQQGGRGSSGSPPTLQDLPKEQLSHACPAHHPGGRLASFLYIKMCFTPGPLLPSADHMGSLQSPEPGSSSSVRGQHSSKIKEQAVLSDAVLIKLLQARLHYK